MSLNFQMPIIFFFSPLLIYSFFHCSPSPFNLFIFFHSPRFPFNLFIFHFLVSLLIHSFFPHFPLIFNKLASNLVQVTCSPDRPVAIWTTLYDVEMSHTILMWFVQQKNRWYLTRMTSVILIIIHSIPFLRPNEGTE